MRIVSTSKLILATLLLSISAFGQATGTIHGTVYDPTGAVQVGARVTVTNVETNQSRLLTSNESGQYTALLLPSGAYTVRFEAEGFKAVLQRNITVAVNTDTEATVTLELATATSEVTVLSDASLVQTATSNLVQVVEQQRIVDLPLNGRSVLQAYDAGTRRDQCGGLWRYTARGNGWPGLLQRRSVRQRLAGERQQLPARQRGQQR